MRQVRSDNLELGMLASVKNIVDTHVVVAMSGGVDSSTVAAYLHQEGYKVTGITLQLYDEQKIGTPKKQGACCAGRDIHDAKQVADKVGFVIDLSNMHSNLLSDAGKASKLWQALVDSYTNTPPTELLNIDSNILTDADAGQLLNAALAATGVKDNDFAEYLQKNPKFNMGVNHQNILAHLGLAEQQHKAVSLESEADFVPAAAYQQAAAHEPALNIPENDPIYQTYQNIVSAPASELSSKEIIEALLKERCADVETYNKKLCLAIMQKAYEHNLYDDTKTLEGMGHKLSDLPLEHRRQILNDLELKVNTLSIENQPFDNRLLRHAKQYLPKTGLSKLVDDILAVFKGQWELLTMALGYNKDNSYATNSSVSFTVNPLYTQKNHAKQIHSLVNDSAKGHVASPTLKNNEKPPSVHL